MSIWEGLAMVVGAIGGFELIKFLFEQWRGKRTGKAKDVVGALNEMQAYMAEQLKLQEQENLKVREKLKATREQFDSLQKQYGQELNDLRSELNKSQRSCQELTAELEKANKLIVALTDELEKFKKKVPQKKAAVKKAAKKSEK